MKKQMLWFSCLLFALNLLGCDAAPKASSTTSGAVDGEPAAEVVPALLPKLTVMSYNIHHGEGTDGVFDLRRLAVVIKSVDPDLVALQEVDKGTTRASGIDQAAELARLTGMYYVFGNAIDYAGGEYGEAILSRYPILESTNYHLPFTAGHERRSAIAVTVQPTQFSEPIQFVGTHWAHDRDDDRVAQAQETDQLFGRGEGKEPTSGPKDAIAFTLLAGDLNAEPRSAPLEALRANWRCLSAASRFGAPLTFPSDTPNIAIDHIYMTPRQFKVFVSDIRVLDEPVASDHAPLVVKLFCERLQVETSSAGMSK